MLPEKVAKWTALQFVDLISVVLPIHGVALMPNRVLLAALRIKTIFLEMSESYGIMSKEAGGRTNVGQNLQYYDIYCARNVTDPMLDKIY